VDRPLTHAEILPADIDRAGLRAMAALFFSRPIFLFKPAARVHFRAMECSWSAEPRFIKNSGTPLRNLAPC
jgi:hypothetical protein